MKTGRGGEREKMRKGLHLIKKMTNNTQKEGRLIQFKYFLASETFQTQEKKKGMLSSVR